MADIETTADDELTPQPAERVTRQSAKGEVTAHELSRAEQAIARRLAESKATIPHLYLESHAQMATAMSALEASGADPRPTINDLVILACGRALAEYPRGNSSYRDGRRDMFSRVNIGFAVATDEAFLVPTIFDADTKSLDAISAEASGLAERARDGSITSPELSGATFTISNLGAMGVDRFQSIIVSPQAAILGVGAINDSGAMALNLACDHRILHGAHGAELLGLIRKHLENPA